MSKYLEKAKGVKGFFNKAALMAAVALAGGSVFAEGATTIDTTAASGALTSMVEAVKGFITTSIPAIVGLLGVALGGTLIWVGWKWIRKGSSKAA